jgi:hypothetical protein
MIDNGLKGNTYRMRSDAVLSSEVESITEMSNHPRLVKHAHEPRPNLINIVSQILSYSILQVLHDVLEPVYYLDKGK